MCVRARRNSENSEVGLMCEISSFLRIAMTPVVQNLVPNSLFSQYCIAQYNIKLFE